MEIETLNAEAEVEPLMAMATQLTVLKKSGPERSGRLSPQRPPEAVQSMPLSHSGGDP